MKKLSKSTTGRVMKKLMYSEVTFFYPFGNIYSKNNYQVRKKIILIELIIKLLNY